MNRENDKIYTLPDLWKGYENYKAQLKRDPDNVTSYFAFPDGYLPNLQIIQQGSGKQDIFIDTVAKTFEADGARYIRYILMYGNGQRYDRQLDEQAPGEDSNTQIRQLYTGSFIAKVSCPMRTLQADNLVLEYVIDTMNLQIEGIQLQEGVSSVVLRPINMSSRYRRPNTENDVNFDEWIQRFAEYQGAIFHEYFEQRFTKRKVE
ncbi:MAG: hypothetical protein NC548_06350 [Lachnospiraceae bacterium]|nr:hypothetical protein [Lachnospiraceae bacterium]